MIQENGPLNPLPKLCQHQLRGCISSRALHLPPCPLGPLGTIFSLSWVLSVPLGPPAPSTLHQDGGSLQRLQSSAGATALRAARLGNEAEKVAPQQSAPSTAALCKAASSTLW